MRYRLDANVVIIKMPDVHMGPGIEPMSPFDVPRHHRERFVVGDNHRELEASIG